MNSGSAFAGRTNPGAPSVERFFQYSLLGLVACAFCALADTGRLDPASLAFLLAGVVWRGLVVAGVVRMRIPQRVITILATAYLFFYPLDYYFVSRDFFAATAHGVCFLGVARILSARTNRDYLYTGTLAFVALIGAAALSTQFRFFFWLALAILFAIGVLTSAEIRRGYQRTACAVGTADARTSRRTGWTLAILVGCSAAGIVLLTTGLFFVVPRTARAASLLFPNGPRLTGFTNSFDLGRFGTVTKDNRPVLHIRSYNKPLPPDLKWRGSALTRFDGRRWSEPPLRNEMVQTQGMVIVADQWQRSRLDGERMLYRVDATNSDTGTLFIAGVPEFINVESPTLIRTPEDSFRAAPSPGEPLGYEVSAERSNPLPYPLSDAERARDLDLPSLDKRIAALGREWSAGADSSDMARASRIEEHLHHGYVYSLDTTSVSESRDPLASFLFTSKRGYCEYFASAMAVLLRTQQIPARVATGFQSGYYNDVSKTWVMRASDAHAWVEGWIEGRGWVTFDPTPPASEPAASGWLGTKMHRLSMYLDAADSAWEQWVLAYNPGQQATLAFRFRNALATVGGGGADLSWLTGALSAGAWWGLMIAALIAVVIMARMFGPRLWKQWKKRQRIRRIQSGGGSAHDAQLLYEQMLEALARRGFQKPAWFTPVEFARNLPQGERERVGAFTDAYNEVRFGGAPGGAARLTQLLEQMNFSGK